MPDYRLYQREHQNPHASMPLVVPYIVLSNTPDEVLAEHIRINSARDDLEWVMDLPAHDGMAIMCGGGPSLADTLDLILDLQEKGGTVFAMNAASKFLHQNGISVDYQVIVDAKQVTSTLVDNEARTHLIASQVHPDTLDAAERPKLWHFAIEGMEALFPPERVKRGGYAMFGGGAACGNCAMTLAYGLGFREFHCLGYDSSHRGTDSHAYRQAMNDGIPFVNTEWSGKTYISQVAMKAQAEKFQITGQQLKQLGCNITVHGDGLLPAMWNTPPENLSEREKYVLMWQMESYRQNSPGAEAVPTFIRKVRPDSLIVDFGCGTGRAALALKDLGYEVFLVDFAGNCRDEEAKGLPFLEWDLTHPCPVRAPYGFCCDVMEHIPTDDVEKVIRNIMSSADTVFFQISTQPDDFGAVIGQSLHLTVRPHEWWLAMFGDMGFQVTWAKDLDHASQFVVRRKKQ